jgi:fucose 4-O-acetylase-like acetyltransferase
MAEIAKTPPSMQPTTRVPFWDSSRFVAVTLVVIGHSVQPLAAASDNALVAYLFIYAFHVPAFAIISGYFSKAEPPGARQMKKVLTDILLPYLIMEAIWSLVQFLVEGKVEFDPTNPSWTLWFLLALGIFRLVLPYLALLRWPLAIAVIASLIVPYFDGVDATFSLSRAIGLLPFFVLGWKLREWGLMDRWLAAGRATWWVRGTALALLAGWLIIVIANIEFFRRTDLRLWFFYKSSYEELGGDQWWGALLRLGLMLLAVILSGAFLLLIPRTGLWITSLGQGTMYVYLLHTFVLYPIRQSGVLSGEQSPIWLPVMILAGIVISIALATPLVRRVFRPIIEPRPRWLFREP